MSSYKIFDPITGEHVTAPTLDDVRAELQACAQRLLDAQTFSVVEVMQDVEGNEVWVGMDSSGLVTVAPVTEPPRRRPPEPADE